MGHGAEAVGGSHLRVLMYPAAFVQAAAGVPIHHTFGNHCLSLPRAMMLRRLGMPASFYAADLAPGWRLLVLDTTEMSGHSGWPQVWPFSTTP